MVGRTDGNLDTVDHCAEGSEAGFTPVNKCPWLMESELDGELVEPNFGMKSC